MQNKENNRFEDIPSYFHGEIKNEGDDLVDKIKENPDFKTVGKIYSLKEKVTQVSLISHEVKAWKNVQKRISRDPGRLILFRFLFSKYAAIALALIALGGVFGTFFHHAPLKPEQNRAISFVAPDGTISELTLSDGTKIWLSPTSRLEYSSRFGTDNRTVTLEGEALFDIAKNQDIPFITKIGDAEIKVHGTRYLANNDASNKRKEIVLLEGKVEYLKNNRSTLLNRGERLTDNRETDEITVQQVDVANYEEWMNGKVYFDNETLEYLTGCLNRWYGVNLKFANEQIKTYKFTGAISKDKPLDYTLNIISLTNKVKFKKEGDTITITDQN